MSTHMQHKLDLRPTQACAAASRDGTDTLHVMLCCAVSCCALLCHRGPLGWLVPSEIQPLETRAAGTGINTFVNFMFTFLIGQVGLGGAACSAPADRTCALVR
jgi:hypothetical protein